MPSQLEAFLATHPHSIYPLTFLLLVMAGTGFPVSGDLVLLTCAYLAYLGKADLSILMPLCIVAIMTGDTIMFHLAKKYGMRLLSVWPFRKIFSKHGVEKSQKKFQVHGYKLVFFARLTPGVRLLFMFTSGLMHLRYRKFILHNLAGGLIMIPCMLHSVTWVAGNKEVIWDWLQRVQWVVLAGVVLFFVTRVARRKRLKRLQKLDEVTTADRSQ